MGKQYIRLYLILMVLSVVLLGVTVSFNDQINCKKEENKVIRINQISYKEIHDANAPIKKTGIYEFQLPTIKDTDTSLFFHTVHQQVKIYINGEQVFQMTPDSQNLFGKTTGCQWSEVRLNTYNSKQNVTIEIQPVYASCMNKDIDVFIGSQYNVFVKLMNMNAPMLLLSVLASILGGLLLLYSLYLKLVRNSFTNLVYLGMFSLLLGFWKLFDLNICEFLWRYSIVVSMIPLIMVMLMTIPFILYVRSCFSLRDNLLWNVPIVASLVSGFGVVIAQFLNWYDLRETLFVTHIVYIITVVVTLYMLFLENRKNGISPKLKQLIYCVCICLIGTILDLISFYFEALKLQMHFGMIGFLVFIIVLGKESIEENIELVQTGMKAKIYEKMAYIDKLTGLYNRAKFEEDVAEIFTKHSSCILVAADLNKLKQCNDTYGHEMGDVYIKTGADVLTKVFSKYGTCYRLGGDEFWVVIVDQKEQLIYDACETIDDYMKAASKNISVPIAMSMAYGCAYCDKREFEDIGLLMRKADRQMYVKKLLMKQEKENQ